MAQSSLAGVNADKVAFANLSNIMGCGIKEEPKTYLEIPLGGNPRAKGF